MTDENAVTEDLQPQSTEPTSVHAQASQEPVATPAPASEPAQTPELTPHQQFLEMLPEDLRESASFTKFSGDSVNDIVAKVAKSYTALEKLHGADKNAILKFPSSEEDEAWNEVYEKLGRPEDVKGYELDKYKENPLYDESSLTEIAELAHQNGVSKKAFQAIVDKYYEQAGALTQQSDEEMERTAEQYVEALKKEWGDAYEQKTNKVLNTLKTHATDEFKQLAADYPWVFDHPAVMQTLDNIVKSSSEDGGPKAGETSSGALSPSEAKAQLAAFEINTQKMKALMTSGHPQRESLMQERERLFRQAYPKG